MATQTLEPAVANENDFSRVAHPAEQWESALADFNRVNAEFDILIEAHNQAVEAVYQECPRVDEFFEVYKLYFGLGRGEAVRRAVMGCCIREFGEGRGYPFSPPEARAAYDAKLVEINAEADRAVDDFMAYQDRHKAAWEKYGVDAAEERSNAFRDDVWEPAIDRLLHTTAPDNQALILKLELAACFGDHDDVMAAIDDAKHLLS